MDNNFITVMILITRKIVKIYHIFFQSKIIMGFVEYSKNKMKFIQIDLLVLLLFFHFNYVVLFYFHKYWYIVSFEYRKLITLHGNLMYFFFFFLS